MDFVPYIILFLPLIIFTVLALRNRGEMRKAAGENTAAIQDNTLAVREHTEVLRQYIALKTKETQ